MTRLALVALVLLQADEVKPKYGVDRTAKDKVYAEMKLGIKLEGNDQMVNFVRSLHPFLSIEKLVVRAEGNHSVLGGGKHKVEYDEARIEAVYDDDPYEIDFQRGLPPADLASDKTRQMFWYLAAAGRNFSLTSAGEYRSDDPNQDHNGEAMDLVALAIVRMPDRPVKEGETFEKEWVGARSEKGKDAKFRFKQKVKVEKVETKDGKRQVTFTGDLSGKVEGAKDPSAEEAWTKCEGKTKTVLEVETGRILVAEGAGKVTGYFRNTGENGQKQELTMTFSSEGKLQVK
jgi:hypothetical protein